MQFTLADLHNLLGGELRQGTMPPCDGDTTLVGRVAVDSREVEPDEVFWGLEGTRFNGAHFAEEAFIRGAAGVVASGRRVEPWAGRWVLQVEDPGQALWKLAGWCRAQYNGPLVAVTGSVGKTTTRQMIDTVLGRRLAGAVSPKNYNNHVGVPLSLLRLERWHKYAVVELAASAPGEIARLAHLVQPSIGVITKIGEAHLGGFGSEAGIAAAKAELLNELPMHGRAVLNADDVWLRRIAKRCSAKIVWVGRSADADLVATDVVSQRGRLSFRVGGQPFDVPVWGRHHLTAALAAIAVGQLFEMDLDEIAAALATFEAVPLRCEVTVAGGITLVNDTYNSSPTAMRAALELLREIDTPGKRIVVAGDMGDLGETAPAWHRRLGEEVVSLGGADWLIACGEHATVMTDAANRAGMPRDRAVVCQRWEEALTALTQTMRSGDAVLVKGARVMGLERILESMKARLSAAA
jgi:UDP-N-acetylmuramoyl-tripeptide--D-alanyl-D-alanine ligase